MVYQYHNDFIDKPPDNFDVTGWDNNNLTQSIENKTLKRFGTQFHPEHSAQGETILQNFIDFCYN